MAEKKAQERFLKKDGTVWTTDKDGIILDLLAAEILARTSRDPSEHYRSLGDRFGRPVYQRIDVPASPDQKSALAKLSADAVQSEQLAGDKITSRLTEAPGNGKSIGGLKVVTSNGWFAARPPGTENIYKIYAESFVGESHLTEIQSEAQTIVNEALNSTQTTS